MTSALYNFAWVLFHMTSNSYFCKQTSCEEDTLHLLKRKRCPALESERNISVCSSLDCG